MSHWLLLILLLLLILAGGTVCYIGRSYLNNMRRRIPGTQPKGAIHVADFENDRLHQAIHRGLDYMEGLPQEDVFLTTRDGLRLHAALFPAPDGQPRFVVGIHGFQSKARHEFAPYIAQYRALGFGMLLADDRAHGQSEGTYATMGVTDRLDCVAWARYLVERFGPDTRLLLHGVSMGAAAVLSATAEDQLPPQVMGAVADCPFAALKEMVVHQLRRLYHLPVPISRAICFWVTRHVAGFDPEEAAPISRVPYAQCPILFVHGKADPLIPISTAQRLYDACPTRKQLLLVDGAAHASSIALAPEQYFDAIRSFFQLSPLTPEP